MDITPTTTSQDMETHLRLYLRYINEKSGGEMIVGMLAPEFVSCDLAQRTLTLSFSVQHWMLNIGGTMHGGLISTAFDTSFGSLTHFFSRGHFITTTNLSIAFLEPVTENSQLVIKVTANRVGRTLCSLMGEAWCVSGDSRRLCDTASATFMFLKENFELPKEYVFTPEPVSRD